VVLSQQLLLQVEQIRAGDEAIVILIQGIKAATKLQATKCGSTAQHGGEHKCRQCMSTSTGSRTEHDGIAGLGDGGVEQSALMMKPTWSWSSASKM
jgi:hypothetical protein